MKTSFTKPNSLTTGILLMILALLCAASTVPPSARADGGIRQDGREKKKDDFTDEDLKVEKIPGKWFLITSVDLQQAADNSVPVFVSQLKTVYGRDAYVGRIKIPMVKIENRSQRALRAVQLRWTISNYDEPENILLEGLTPLMQAQIEPSGTPITLTGEHLYFNKVVKPLLKDGELNFRILLRIGVQESRFADGTVWQRTKQAAFIKMSLAQPRFGTRQARFEPMLFFDITAWRKPNIRSLTCPSCEEQPRSFASAFLISQQIIDPPCRENWVCGYDPVNNKNICIPTSGSFCDLNGCDAEGH